MYYAWYWFLRNITFVTGMLQLYQPSSRWPRPNTSRRSPRPREPCYTTRHYYVVWLPPEWNVVAGRGDRWTRHRWSNRWWYASLKRSVLTVETAAYASVPCYRNTRANGRVPQLELELQNSWWPRQLWFELHTVVSWCMRTSREAESNQMCGGTNSEHFNQVPCKWPYLKTKITLLQMF